MLEMHYGVSARRVLDDREIRRALPVMRAAGVGTLWLYGYFFGRCESRPEEMVRARAVLENEGYAVHVLSVPVGHPGNSLDPVHGSDSDLLLPAHWTYRVGRDGETQHYCACVNEAMLRDNIAAAAGFREMGFRTVFYDDDLRLGNYGPEVQGCFCDACLDDFGGRTGAVVTRRELVRRLDAGDPVADVWMRYNCEKITGFLRHVTLPGMQSGLMVMQDGDERHGIDIRGIRRAMPGTLFRVGEGHFDDGSFESEAGKAALTAGLTRHMALVAERGRCFSESTVFPANALSPDNWIEKMRLEIRCGIRRLFLMSGTWFLTPPYWKKLTESRGELEALAASLDA